MYNVVLCCCSCGVVFLLCNAVQCSEQTLLVEELPPVCACGIQDGGACELYPTGPLAAGRALQLEHSHIVGRSRAKHMNRHIQGYLRSSTGPVPTQVEAIDPQLALE